MGRCPDLPADIYSVRALVQRLRSKLQVAGADLRIEAIRGYGFRVSGETDRDVGRSRLRRA